MMRMNVNGIEIRYTIEGSGPWLTMSHSLACNLHMWDDLAARLCKSFKVLRFDTRGHGLTSAPPGPYSLDMLADDLHGLLTKLGVDSTHFIGFSMGGMIAQAYALKYPGRFRSLVLSDTTSRYPPEATPGRLKRIAMAETEGMEALVNPTLRLWLTDASIKARPAKVEELASMIRGTPVNGYVGCTMANMKINFTDQLKVVRCPTLVIVGEHDPGTPVSMAKVLRDAIPGAELVVIPSASHFSFVEQPELFSRVVDDFLMKVCDPAR